MKMIMIKKRILASALCCALAATACPVIAPPAAEVISASAKNVSRDGVPWNTTQMPQLQSVRDKSADQDVKFTHKEWTGEQGYTDASGEKANAADVYRINVQDASMSSTRSVPSL